MKLLNKTNYAIFTSFILLLALGFISYKAYSYSVIYDTVMLEEAEKNKVKKYMDSPLEDVVNLGFTKLNSFVFKKDETKLRKQRVKQITQENKTMMDRYVIYYFVVLGLILLTYFFYAEKVFILSVITASLISWFVGILAPILTVEVFKDLPIVGYTIFKYESKSIWATIEQLWYIDRYFIAVMVGLFSVVVPVIKTLAIYISLFYNKSLQVINFIGKWSMADVFIVALLLANLSLNTDEFTDAKMQMALYFFSMYVVFSILASFLAHRHISKIQKQSE